MISHPNRSKSAALRYVVYSLASHTALTSDGNTEAALDRARRTGDGTDEFFVVFGTRSRDDLNRFDGARWPRDAQIVWRGSNSLAQRCRLATTYPVYDVARPDFSRDCRPIGEAQDEAEALAVLKRYFDAGDAPAAVELMDRDTDGGQLWAYWPVWG